MIRINWGFGVALLVAAAAWGAAVYCGAEAVYGWLS